jgi:hypothetical protein
MAKPRSEQEISAFRDVLAGVLAQLETTSTQRHVVTGAIAGLDWALGGDPGPELLQSRPVTHNA